MSRASFNTGTTMETNGVSAFIRNRSACDFTGDTQAGAPTRILNRENMSEQPHDPHAALLTRLEQLCRKPVKPPKSLQPTPEAGKSKIRRLRRKRQLLLQRSRTISPGDLSSRNPSKVA